MFVCVCGGEVGGEKGVEGRRKKVLGEKKMKVEDERREGSS